jgi:hypothetical protein
MGLRNAHLPFIITIDLLLGADVLAPLSHYAFDNLVCSPEVMARRSPLSEVAAANVAEVENADRVADAAEMYEWLLKGLRPPMVEDTFQA